MVSVMLKTITIAVLRKYSPMWPLVQARPKALTLQPGDPDALELRGTLKYLRWLLNLAPDPAEAAGLMTDAEKDLRAAVAANPEQASAWNTLSHLLINKLETAEAKLAALRAYDADPYLTNANLTEEVASGRFRQDLLFRLNTIEIRIPALRDRREDLPLLAQHFLRQHAQRYRKRLTGFESSGMQMLLEHPWPGNVRELDHAIERAVLMAQGPLIKAGDLGLRTTREGGGRLEDMSLEDVECFLIKKAMTRYDGNVSQAAKGLGLSRSALYRRLQRYGL